MSAPTPPRNPYTREMWRIYWMLPLAAKKVVWMTRFVPLLSWASVVDTIEILREVPRLNHPLPLYWEALCSSWQDTVTVWREMLERIEETHGDRRRNGP